MKEANFDIDLVRAFVAVAEARSFTKAAQRLYRTQSAVSMKIKRLEEQIGLKLLERDTTTVRLTSAGERALAISYGLIKVHEDALQTLTEAAHTARVILATSETYALCLLPSALTAISDAMPQVEIEIRCGHSWIMLDAIEREGIDLVVATHFPKRSDGEPLTRERLLWVSARNFTVDPEAPVPLALYPEGCLYRRSALAALNKSGRAMRIAYTSSQHEGLMAAVASGRAVTVMIESAVPRAFRVLEEADGFPDLSAVDVTLYRRQTTNSPLIHGIAEAIRRNFAQSGAATTHGFRNRSVCAPVSAGLC